MSFTPANVVGAKQIWRETPHRFRQLRHAFAIRRLADEAKRIGEPLFRSRRVEVTGQCLHRAIDCGPAGRAQRSWASQGSGYDLGAVDDATPQAWWRPLAQRAEEPPPARRRRTEPDPASARGRANGRSHLSASRVGGLSVSLAVGWFRSGGRPNWSRSTPSPPSFPCSCAGSLPSSSPLRSRRRLRGPGPSPFPSCCSCASTTLDAPRWPPRLPRTSHRAKPTRADCRPNALPGSLDQVVGRDKRLLEGACPVGVGRLWFC